ncbi:hypothetical protein A3C77_01710 [Candidatus Giovannonibacteria bacterium RIFCSPHIGHO2_02_FULL_45_13]|uniref:N-acetyltransferase domain-containing protein n=1 Tax=Candidatus Giovannonibacteria bacterium RIFCSPHIGHO2_01_FULL_45_23 TaxID=1798325 RepID=A0A1F5VHS7_9BACT|nr:MAG: hypothetical protein A2834_03430 [Candidatus Giovannonibacteria bacterium RIFCSPHIGHO2_01_FULL_45_23]OGF75691.1 MAG: hypothetical protein A3C77_01710 [Candidatus Giovannonibacteria bacterium RIFCSPHIGHO2_02_FULL_45_13]
MKNTNCELCGFENPKPTATAVVIRDQKLLVAKRAEEPFKGEWDFIGGYLNKNETPKDALKREIKEELGVNSLLTYLGAFSGTAKYKNFDFPVLSFAYLTELVGDIKLNKAENSEISWVPFSELKTIAFDSNKKILEFVKKKFVYDLNKVRKLVSQLDSAAVVNEQSLYKAMLDGYVSKIEDGGELIGMGWIFPRQTKLRRQAIVEDMIVDDRYRGKGFGEKILLDLIQWAKEQGVEVVELTTNSKRLAANFLYQKAGFKLHETNHYLLKLN